MNKILGIGIIIALLANVAVMLIGFGYLQDEINQLKPDSDSSPTPPPTSTPTTTPPTAPEQTPTPTPPVETSANLVVNCTLKLVWETAPRLRVLGSITNVGTETAYNVTIHVRTWFSNGKEAITIDHKLLIAYGLVPPSPVYIEGNETYRAGALVGMRSFEIPYEIRKDWEQGYVDNDCISTYQVTASWDY